jgi:hypothetical protein
MRVMSGVSGAIVMYVPPRSVGSSMMRGGGTVSMSGMGGPTSIPTTDATHA